MVRVVVVWWAHLSVRVLFFFPFSSPPLFPALHPPRPRQPPTRPASDAIRQKRPCRRDINAPKVRLLVNRSIFLFFPLRCTPPI